MKKKIPNQRPKGKIPDKAIIVTQPEREDYPVFSFLHSSDQHCLLSDWRGDELSELIKAFKTMEALPWNQLQRHHGLGFKVVDSFSRPLPQAISPDETIFEVRVCQRKRVFGYRAGNVFRIIWFDRNHEICPEGKHRRA